MSGGHRHSQYCLNISGIPGNAWFPQLTVTYIFGHSAQVTIDQISMWMWPAFVLGPYCAYVTQRQAPDIHAPHPYGRKDTVL